MSTKIEWATETWNPTTGCDRTSPGCDNCYALDMAKRLKAMGSEGYQNDGDPHTSGPGFAFTQHEDRLVQPLRWRHPRKVFVNSMSDLFHHDADDLFLAQVFAVMGLTPRHIYQVLTKRPKAMAGVLRDPDGEFRYKIMLARKRMDYGAPVPLWPLPNVWLGTSIENDRYTFRAGHLRDTQAAVRFLSLEPLLGPLPSLDLTGIDWVITGAESGPHARPMDEDWVREIRDLCVKTGTPFFYKQRLDERGHKVGLPDLDGRSWAEYPA